MNIPEKAQAILRRMKRRGYKRIAIGIDPDDAVPCWVRITFVGGEPTGRHLAYYTAEGKSILACCRDIEKQWRAEQ